MINYREILRLRSLGLNNSKIAESMGIARQTVITVLRQADAQSLDWQTAESMTNRDLITKLRGQGRQKSEYKMPDYEHVHRELAKPGMTQQLLWYEYYDQCRAANEIPYQLTQFKKYYREYAVKNKATMHIKRKPGEIAEVDWAGKTAHLIDADTGEVMDAYVFVAALPYSGYAYVEAFMSMDQASWITAHVHTFEYFGGVARMLVPDNLKTGVIKNTRTELILNKSYQEMAEHYGIAIMPARVRAAKDKASVEGVVGNISTFILAAIRNQTFFTLHELNEIIRERLHAFNHKPFQKKDGSRATWYAEEREYLLPLPRNQYEMAIWKTATVAFNYHIAVDGQYYSVPFEYIKRKVDVRMTQHVIEAFLESIRLCSHVRLYGRRGQYSTDEAHMPPNHLKYTQWNGERFRNWAAKIGSNAVIVVETILTSYKVEQQGYRACMALLKLAEQFSDERLDAACARALYYTPRPSYKSIQTILKAGQDQIKSETKKEPSSKYGFTRGADYYKEGDK